MSNEADLINPQAFPRPRGEAAGQYSVRMRGVYGSPDEIAFRAYEIADAMLNARKA